MTRAYRFLSPIVLLSAVCSWTPPSALAQGNLNVYCSVQAEWCQAVANEFQRQTGIRVGLTLKGSGETLAQVTAEAANPRGDVWFGGTGDPHLAAAEQNLTLAYKSANLDRLHDWARKQAEQSGFKTVGIYAEHRRAHLHAAAPRSRRGRGRRRHPAYLGSRMEYSIDSRSAGCPSRAPRSTRRWRPARRSP